MLAQCLQHCVNSDNWALEASAGVGRRVAELAGTQEGAVHMYTRTPMSFHSFCVLVLDCVCLFVCWPGGE